MKNQRAISAVAVVFLIGSVFIWEEIQIQRDLSRVRAVERLHDYDIYLELMDVTFHDAVERLVKKGYIRSEGLCPDTGELKIPYAMIITADGRKKIQILGINTEN